MQCVFIKPDKKQCGAHAMNGSQFCFRHDVKSKQKAHKASKKGGENRSETICLADEIVMESSEDVQTFIAKTINMIWRGKIPTKTGSCLGFLARCWLDAHEQAGVEKRLADLEARMIRI